MSEPIKRFSLVLLTAIFVFVVVLGSVSFVQPARAQAPTMILPTPGAPILVADSPVTIAKESFASTLKTAVLSASLQAMSYFARKVAYDSAVWLSSGGKGQNPFARTSSFGSYITKTADKAVGAAIEALGTPFGLNLCKIPDARLDLILRLSIPNLYGLSNNGKGGPAEPNCSLSDFQKNWTMKNFNSMYGAENIADRFNADFQSSQSDLGIFLSATAKIDKLRAEEVYNKDKQRTEDQGAIGFTDLISGNIKTPGAVMMQEIKAGAPSEGKKVSDQQINSAFSAGVYQILPSTLSMFLNTLASQMLTNYQTKGMFPFGIGYDETGGSADYASQSAGGLSGRQLAQQIFSEYKVATVNPADNYNLLARFSACTDNPGPDNCVADADLVAFLQEGMYGGNPITIGEALKKNARWGERKLISPLRVAENKDPYCFEGSYCYRNVQKLREARILPLGFEIATYLSDPDIPWTLGDVIKGYNDCAPRVDSAGKEIGFIYDPVGHPFCHLIDPNWILKLPDTKCNAMAIGSSLVAPGVPNRQEECVDMSSCVKYENNQCVTYGYCTKEKNVSKFAVDTCDEQYNSCRTFSNKITGEQMSYLYRTLDTSNCNADSVGCRLYVFDQTLGGSWRAIGNKSVYLNGKVSTNCSANSLGCTAFNLLSNPGGAGDLYLRKAPDYLKCYDKNLSTPTIDWPQTESDLSLLEPKADCTKYAKPCIPEEVGCSWYTPVDLRGNLLSLEKIPGKYDPGTDQCNEKCVGYDAYREVASNFSVGQDLAYIIPKSGKECTSEEEGCSGFTNLSTITGGLEQVDYYSFLRSCILPDETKQKSFYTYTGSSINGYELVVYNLEEDKIGDSDSLGESGGPKYFYKTASELADYKAQCNEQQYRIGGENADCRQFNDASGKVYYRLLSQTVAVSDQCAPYRLNETVLTPAVGVAGQVACEADGVKGRWNNTDPANSFCEVCLQNGEYRVADGHCYYYGLPSGVELSSGKSKACSASANTCRQYKGSRANNLAVKLFADFDSSEQDLVGWSALPNKGSITASLESTRLGEHSLGYTATAGLGGVERKDLILQPGESYEVTFWAKGDTGSLTVGLTNNAPVVELGSVSISNVWRNYKIGSSKILGGTIATTTLSFKTAGSGHLFLDNVRLVRMEDVKYLVKNSLSVDSSCDSNLNDNNPGQALGCTEYRVKNGGVEEQRYLTNFSYLCREGAIGCTALLDTQNTLNTDQGEIFNVWVPSANLASMKGLLGSEKEPCVVPAGADGCYIVGPIVTSTPQNLVMIGGGVFKDSTFIIPADTSTTTPMYLVSSEVEPMNCNSASIGCTEAGAAVQVNGQSIYVTTTVQNDPALYVSSDSTQTGILCQSYSAGCDVFSSKQGINVFFKDPKIMGGNICAYNENAVINGVKYKGWFNKYLGRCANNSNKTCTIDADCPGSTCSAESKNTVPCYDNYLVNGNTYGLWSYGNIPNYKDNVGECPAEQDSCKEFVDHNDGDRPYYLIANDKLGQGDCDNGVSRKYGCILLDDTGQPNKFWNSTDTYSASALKSYEKVQPSVVGTKDTNIIAKVVRDRECSEWLYPSQIHPNSQGVNKSYGLGVCNKAQSGTGFVSQCANDISMRPDQNEFLTAEKYVLRPTSFNDIEYSGFSLFNQYQIATLKVIQMSVGEEIKYYLVHAKTNNNCSPSDKTGVNVCGIDWNFEGGGNGRCYAGDCVYKLDGKDITGKNLFQILDSNPVGPSICRGYPEVDSPFSSAVKPVNDINKTNDTYVAGYDGVNACEVSNDCECNYKKIMYNDGTPVKFVTKGSPTINTEMDPEIISKVQTLEGYKGYCLQADLRRTVIGKTEKEINNTCLIWYPVDLPAGVQDVGAIKNEAAYRLLDDEKKYVCLANDPIAPDLVEEINSFTISNWEEPANTRADYYNTFYPLENGVDHLTDTEKKDYELPSVYSEKVNGSQTDITFDVFDIPANARVVVNKDFFIRTNENTSPEQNKYEKFVRLNYQDVMGKANTESAQWLTEDDIKKIDVFFDLEEDLPAVTPNVVVFDIHSKIEDPDAVTGWTKKAGSGAPKSGTMRPGNSPLTYWEWFSSGDVNFTVWDEDHLPTNSNKQVEADFQSTVGDNTSGYGVRVVFEKDANSNLKILKGAWLVVMRDKFNARGAANKIGFFFVIHLTNGKCKLMANISDPSGSIVSKPVTWRMKTDDLAFEQCDGAEACSVERSTSTEYAPYGLVSSGANKIDKYFYVNPFSAYGYKKYNSKEDLFKTYDTNFTGGVPLTVYGAKVKLASYVKDCSNFIRYTSADNSYCGMLDRMVAKVFDVKELQADGSGYDSASASFSVTDAASPLSTSFKQYPPRVASVDMWSCNNPSEGKVGCGMSKINQFTVNSTDNDNVYIPSNGPVSVKFFAWADGAQMPLRRFTVDFDNGSAPYVSENQSQTNFKYVCVGDRYCRDATSGDLNMPCENTAQCKKVNNNWTCELASNAAANVVQEQEAKLRKGFGSTEETGCEARYYEVFGQYSCDAVALYRRDIERFVWNEDNAGSNKYNPTAANSGHLAVMRTNPDSAKPWEILLNTSALKRGLIDGSVVCAYRPKVQVLDNWGWCSGRCNHGEYTAAGVPPVASLIADPNNWLNGCYSEIPAPALPNIYNQCSGNLTFVQRKNIQNHIPFGGFGSEKNVIVIPSY